MDQILVKGLRCRGKHGTTMQENTFGQEFEVDAALDIDLSRPCKTDDAEDSLDRRALIQVISRTIEGVEHCDLPERLAENICNHVLDTFPSVEKITLTLLQLQPPIIGDFDSIGVKMTRSRE